MRGQLNNTYKAHLRASQRLRGNLKRLTPALGGAILALALMVWAADLRKHAAEEAGFRIAARRRLSE